MSFRASIQDVHFVRRVKLRTFASFEDSKRNLIYLMYSSKYSKKQKTIYTKRNRMHKALSISYLLVSLLILVRHLSNIINHHFPVYRRHIGKRHRLTYMLFSQYNYILYIHYFKV